jgi:hypothetical protein
LKSFIYTHKNRIIKPITLFKKVSRGGQEEKQRGELIKAHYMHVWKCHNETPLHNQYRLNEKITCTEYLSLLTHGERSPFPN